MYPHRYLKLENKCFITKRWHNTTHYYTTLYIHEASHVLLLMSCMVEGMSSCIYDLVVPVCTHACYVHIHACYVHFFLKTLFTFLIFLKSTPNTDPLRRSCRINRVPGILPIAGKVSSKDAGPKNYAILDLHVSDKISAGGVVDSKMLLFYRSQIGQFQIVTSLFTTSITVVLCFVPSYSS